MLERQILPLKAAAIAASICAITYPTWSQRRFSLNQYGMNISVPVAWTSVRWSGTRLQGTALLQNVWCWLCNKLCRLIKRPRRPGRNCQLCWNCWHLRTVQSASIDYQSEANIHCQKLPLQPLQSLQSLQWLCGCVGCWNYHICTWQGEHLWKLCSHKSLPRRLCWIDHQTKRFKWRRMWHMLYGHLGPSFAWWRQWHRGLRQRNWEPAASTFNAATCGNLASSTFPSWKDSSFTCKSMWQFDTFFVIFLAHKWPILPFAYSPWILSSDKDSMWKWWSQRNPFTDFSNSAAPRSAFWEWASLPLPAMLPASESHLKYLKSLYIWWNCASQISSIKKRLHFLFIHALIRGILAGLSTI